VSDPPRGLFVGLTTVDLIHRLERLPAADEKVTAQAQELVAGGPAAVAAIAFAALGGLATLVTGLGSHPLAELARADLTRHGVTVHDLADHDHEPAVSAVRVQEATGARSVSSPDAAGAGDLRIPDGLPSLVDAADVVLIDGHHAALAVAAGAAARAQFVPVVLDAGRWRPVFASLLPLAQFVVASAAFALDGTSADPSAIVDLGPDAAACSAGPGPIRWAVPGESGAVPVRPVAGGDTNGAGDVLHGAVAFAVAAVGAGRALARWPEVLRFAADVATVRVESSGARAWLADPRPREWGRAWMI
jgi:sugar/nucleoside kinase (ribokinase family)